jgi:hypothetical protein
MVSPRITAPAFPANTPAALLTAPIYLMETSEWNENEYPSIRLRQRSGVDWWLPCSMMA